MKLMYYLEDKPLNKAYFNNSWISTSRVSVLQHLGLIHKNQTKSAEAAEGVTKFKWIKSRKTFIKMAKLIRLSSSFIMNHDHSSLQNSGAFCLVSIAP